MRIFVICDSPYLFTGLARVNRNIIDGLRNNGHEVFLGSWGWDQVAFPLNENSQWIYKDIKTKKEFVSFPLSKDPKNLLNQTYDILKSIPCDILLTIGDYWNFSGFELLKSKLNYSYKWISYFTIESKPINESYIDFFRYMDAIMVPSKFGKRVVEESTGLKAFYVPYGIDHSVFSPISEENISSMRKERGIEDKIRFINVSKNQQRKNLPAFLEALKIANEIDNRIIGYLHTNVDKKSQSQINIKNIIKRLGIENIISLPKNKISLDIGCSDERLREEYCCSDALVLSSVAEGFGFPLLEAQSCGIPVIGTNCSSIPELSFYKYLVVDSVSYYGPMEQEVGIICVDDLVQKMCSIVDYKYSKEEIVNFTKGFSWNKTNNIIENVISCMDNNIIIPVEEV